MDQCLIAKDWKSKCSPIENWLNKLWHTPAINVMGTEKKIARSSVYIAIKYFLDILCKKSKVW